MAFYEGKKMRITFDGKEIFHEVDCTLNASTEFKDIATKDTVGTESSPGTQSWSVSVNGYASPDTTTENDIKALADAWKASTLAAVTLTDDVSGHVIFSGNAYVENFSVGAPNDETVTMDYSLKGNGELTIGTVV